MAIMTARTSLSRRDFIRDSRSHEKASERAAVHSAVALGPSSRVDGLQGPGAATAKRRSARSDSLMVGCTAYKADSPRCDQAKDRKLAGGTLPPHFCWTRFGTEAGETIDAILERKEIERRRNGGVFLWGIGNAIGPSMRELVGRVSSPEVLFSPIRSSPRSVDVSPSTILVWRTARDLYGRSVSLPRWSVVRSRGGGSHRTPRHYALVCHSKTPLKLREDLPMIAIGDLQNLLSASRVGASQVTAVVRYHQTASSSGGSYRVAMRIRLTPPFLLELADPHPVSC